MDLRKTANTVVLATGIATGVAGCSSSGKEGVTTAQEVTKQNISNVLSNEAKSTGLNLGNYSDKLSVRPTGNSIGMKYGTEREYVQAGLESLSNSPILKVEYKKVGETFGALVTFKHGNKVDSLFITGSYNGGDLKLKSTVGAMQKDVQGKKIGQIFTGIEGQMTLNENVLLGAYANKTITQSRDLGTVTKEEKVAGGRIITETTKRFEGYGKTSAGVSVEMILNENNKISTSAGYAKTNKSIAEFSGKYSHLTDDRTTEFETEISANTTGDNQIIFSVGKKPSKNTEVTLELGTRKYNDSRDNFAGINFSYHFGGNNGKYSGYSQNDNFRFTEHSYGSAQASRTVYGEIKTKRNERFIPDEVKIENKAPVINSLSLSKTILTEGENLTVTVDTTDETPNKLVYTWYLNGKTFTSGSSNQIEIQAKDLGTNVLKVSVSDGEKISEKTVNFKVEKTPEVKLTETTETSRINETNFVVEYKEVNTLEKGVIGNTIQEGQNGYTEVVKKIFKDQNGKVVKEEIVSQNVIAPKNKIVEIGTKEKAPEVKLTETTKTSRINETNFVVEYKEVNTLEKGVIGNTIQEGQNGYTEVVKKIFRDQNGKVVKEEIVSQTVIAPINKIVEIGTKEKTPETKLTETIETSRKDEIMFTTEYKQVDTLPEGEIGNTIRQGQNGYTEVTEKVFRDQNGKEVKRETVSEKVVNPTNEVKEIGTLRPTIETVKTNETDFVVEYVNNPNLLKGKENTLVEGEKGYTIVEKKVYKKDGTVIKEEIIKETVVAPKNKKVERGTLEVDVDADLAKLKTTFTSNSIFVTLDFGNFNFIDVVEIDDVAIITKREVEGYKGVFSIMPRGGIQKSKATVLLEHKITGEERTLPIEMISIQ